jgi:tetraspanin-5
LFGFAVFGIGIYAWIEKETFTRLSSLSIGVLFDPAFIFLVVGSFVFIIGFCGCVGALRENTNLLLMFSFALGIIFFAELALGILIFMYKDKVKDEVKQNLVLMIQNYREDEDLHDLIDWIQRDWLKCCGIAVPDDWDQNSYFRCKKTDPWIESCGVPPSCCYPEYMQNRQCGYGVRNKTIGQEVNKIYQDGCLKKGEEWLKFHILPVSIVVVCFAVLQILGICSAQSLRSDINTQKSKWFREHPRLR